MLVLNDGKGCVLQPGTAEHRCADCCYLGMFTGFQNVAHIVLACAQMSWVLHAICIRQLLHVLASVRQRSLQCVHVLEKASVLAPVAESLLVVAFGPHRLEARWLVVT